MWGEKTEITPNIPWVEEVKRYLGEKITVINEFDGKAKKEIKKKKELESPRDWWSTKILVEKVKSCPKRLAECIQKNKFWQKYHTGVVLG